MSVTPIKPATSFNALLHMTVVVFDTEPSDVTENDFCINVVGVNEEGPECLLVPYRKGQTCTYENELLSHLIARQLWIHRKQPVVTGDRIHVRLRFDDPTDPALPHATMTPKPLKLVN